MVFVGDVAKEGSERCCTQRRKSSSKLNLAPLQRPFVLHLGYCQHATHNAVGDRLTWAKPSAPLQNV
eukprot:2547784-Amphidinium_carterae.1